MKKQFVIEETTSWTKKDGTTASFKSYFQTFTGYPLPLIHLANLDDCKKYNSRADALIDWRKYFNNKRAKVISIQ